MLRVLKYHSVFIDVYLAQDLNLKFKQILIHGVEIKYLKSRLRDSDCQSVNTDYVR